MIKEVKRSLVSVVAMVVACVEEENVLELGCGEKEQENSRPPPPFPNTK